MNQGPPPLSQAQAQFAEAHEPIGEMQPGWAPEGSVFMYRERPGCTDRWHVAADGTQLDADCLHYA